MLKVTVWALLGAGLLNALALLPQQPGTALVLDWVSPGAYTIFAATTAAAAHERKDLVVLVLVITLLASYPFTVQELARVLIPIGSAILAAGLLRTTITQEQEARRERPRD